MICSVSITTIFLASHAARRGAAVGCRVSALIWGRAGRPLASVGRSDFLANSGVRSKNVTRRGGNSFLRRTIFSSAYRRAYGFFSLLEIGRFSSFPTLGNRRGGYPMDWNMVDSLV